MRGSDERCNLPLATCKGSRALNTNHRWNSCFSLATGIRENSDRAGTQIQNFVNYVLIFNYFLTEFGRNAIQGKHKKTNCHLEHVELAKQNRLCLPSDRGEIGHAGSRD